MAQKRKGFYGIVFVFLICFLLIVFSQKASQPAIHIKSSTAFQSIQFEPNFDSTDSSLEEKDISIDQILNTQRDRIRRELDDYVLPYNQTLNNYTLETKGQPVRTVVFTTWRSGSTFLGDILNSLPANFYHYEPLLDYGIVQVRGPPYADAAILTLKNLLNCNYTDLHAYLDYGKVHNMLFTHNIRLWSYCEVYPQYCWEPKFLNKFCKLFPFQSMKTVRMRLKLAEALLEDKGLNVKVILLVRDPRGTMQSRRHRDWCPGAPDCDQSSYLCADLVADYSAAIRLKKLYPSRFRVIRYEDLSLNPYQMTKDLFTFIGLSLHPKVKFFLDSHTTMNIGGVSSTFRDSKNAPFHWKNELNYTEVQQIENNCREAMKLWGYVRTNSSNLNNFFPLAGFEVQ